MKGGPNTNQAEKTRNRPASRRPRGIPEPDHDLTSQPDMKSSLYFQPKRSLTAGLSQKSNRLSGPVSTVFLCPDTGASFSGWQAEIEHGASRNTVAGCLMPERTPNPGLGFKLSKNQTMKKTATRKGTATRAHAPQTEGATVLTLYRQANLTGAPIAEAGPVARLSFVPTATKDDPSFWYAYTMDENETSEKRNAHLWRPVFFHHYFIVEGANDTATHFKRVLDYVRFTSCDLLKPGIICSYATREAIQWCNRLEDGLIHAMGFNSDVVHIVNPEAHLDGRTMEQFAHAVLLALFGDGALYDLREEAVS